jgi:uncharacterized membrane protein
MIAMIALIALGGCGQQTPPESRTDTTRAPDDSAHGPGTSGAPQNDSVLVALGNEPFWNVRVTAREILYRDPEHQDGYRFQPVAVVEEGGARVFRTRRNIPAGDPGPRTLELRIRQGACSDGMSDNRYSMIALLKIGEDTLSGCARTEADTARARTGGP